MFKSKGMLSVFFTSKLPLAHTNLWRMISMKVSAGTSVWICHVRSDIHWHIACPRYGSKRYLEPTGGKARSNLTFRIYHASQKNRDSCNFVG